MASPILGIAVHDLLSKLPLRQSGAATTRSDTEAAPRCDFPIWTRKSSSGDPQQSRIAIFSW